MYGFVIICALLASAFSQLIVDFENQSLGQLTKCTKSKLGKGSSSVRNISDFDAPPPRNGQFVCVISGKFYCLKSDFVEISKYSYIDIEYLTKDCDITNGCSLRVTLRNKFRNVEEHLLPPSNGKWHRFRKLLPKIEMPEDYMIILRSSSATLILINYIGIRPNRSRARRKRSMSARFNSEDSDIGMTSKSGTMGIISSLTEEDAPAPGIPTTPSELVKTANQWPAKTGSEKASTENNMELAVSLGKENTDHSVNVNGMFATMADNSDGVTNNYEYFGESASDVHLTETSSFSDRKFGETKVPKLNIPESSVESSVGLTPTVAIGEYNSDTHTPKTREITTASDTRKQPKSIKAKRRSSCPVVTVNSASTVPNQPTQLAFDSSGDGNSGETTPSTILDTSSVITSTSGMMTETFDSGRATITDHVNFVSIEIIPIEMNNSSTDSADNLPANGTSFGVVVDADEVSRETTATNSKFESVTDKYVTDPSVTVTEWFLIYPESTVDDLDIYMRTSTNESSESISSDEITVDDITTTIISELSTTTDGDGAKQDMYEDMDTGNDGNNGSTPELPLDLNEIEDNQTILQIITEEAIEGPAVDALGNPTHFSVTVFDSTGTSVNLAGMDRNSTTEFFQVVGSDPTERNSGDVTQLPVSLVETGAENSIMSREVGNELTTTDFLSTLTNTDGDQTITHTFSFSSMTEIGFHVVEESTEFSQSVANFSGVHEISEIPTVNTTLGINVEPIEQSVLSTLGTKASTESTLINSGVGIGDEASTTGSTSSGDSDTTISPEDLFTSTKSTEEEWGSSEYVSNRTDDEETRFYTTSETYISRIRTSSTLTERAVDAVGDTVGSLQNINNFTETEASPEIHLSTAIHEIMTAESIEEMVFSTPTTESSVIPPVHIPDNTSNEEERLSTETESTETVFDESQRTSMITKSTFSGFRRTTESQQIPTDFTETLGVSEIHDESNTKLEIHTESTSETILSTLKTEPRETVPVNTSKETLYTHTTTGSTETSTKETNSSTQSSGDIIKTVDSNDVSATEVRIASDSDADYSTQKTTLSNEDTIVSTTDLPTGSSIIELSASLNSSTEQSDVSELDNIDAAITDITTHLRPVVNTDVTTYSSSNVEESYHMGTASRWQICHSAIIVLCVFIPTYFR